MFLFPEVRYLNEFSRPRIRPATPEFGSKRTPHLRSTVPNVQRHMAYFAAIADVPFAPVEITEIVFLPNFRTPTGRCTYRVSRKEVCGPSTSQQSKTAKPKP